jgi:serine/threonine protein kinase/class 3 adenylate cyclase
MESPFPPRCAARFVAQRLLASGGAGAVYLAIQSGLERQVAVKVLHNRLVTDSENVERFLNEARITATFSHPHIVSVIDCGVEDGTPWVVYEYLEGESLRDVMRAGPSHWRDALQVACQVAAALEATHALQVLHRDIKPENVLRDAAGRYKVTDFGIAKWTRGRQDTPTGVIHGTPAYMSPEQARGDPATAASDIYALGVVLYEMITGQRPFWNENMALTLQLHVEAPIPRAGQLCPEVPAAVDDLIGRALAKSAGGRFASARAMRQAMETLIGPVPADPEPALLPTRDPETLAEALAQLRAFREEVAHCHAKLRLYLDQSPGTFSRSFIQVPRTVVEGLDPLLWVDRYLRIVDINPKMIALLFEGAHPAPPPRDVKGQPLAAVDRLSWAPGILATLLEDARRQGFPSECVVKRSDPAGQVAHFAFHAESSADGGHFMVQDVTARARIEECFSRYVGSQVLAALGESADSDFLTAERIRMSVVCADLRFPPGALSELPPADLQTFINELLDGTIDVVDRNRATVNQVQGDRLTILCGAPFRTPEHAAQALKVGVEMLAAHEKLMAYWDELAIPGLRRLEIGIGIHTGMMVVGNMGSRRRTTYAAVGADAWLAGHLCTRAPAGQILMSLEAFNAVRVVTQKTPDYFSPPLKGFRQHPPVEAPGFAEPVATVIHERGEDA